VDPALLRARVDLDLATAGVEEGCRVRKTKLFCVPATKTVLNAEIDEVPIETLPVVGQTLTDARICYRLACRDEPPPVVATDQFGVHRLERRRVGLLCTPAFEGSPGPTTTLPRTCTSDTDCDDGDVCTLDECGFGDVCFNHPIDGCCTDDAGCDDADPCTDDACDLQSNQCRFDPNGAPGCAAATGNPEP
jgi:hypothetical protein